MGQSTNTPCPGRMDNRHKRPPQIILAWEVALASWDQKRPQLSSEGGASPRTWREIGKGRDLEEKVRS